MAQIAKFEANSQIGSELASFVVDLTASGQREFAKLTVRDLLPDSA